VCQFAKKKNFDAKNSAFHDLFLFFLHDGQEVSVFS
jgi:hypothetical protein